MHIFSYCCFSSVRYGHWHKDKASQGASQKNLPRIIVFIMGGVTFSELRCAYEVTNDKKNWEVIVGKYAGFFFHHMIPMNYLNRMFRIWLKNLLKSQSKSSSFYRQIFA